MIEIYALGSKTWACRIDDDSEKQKAKGTKKAVIKRLIRYENYIDSLYNDTVILRPQRRFKSDYHDIYTE